MTDVPAWLGLAGIVVVGLLAAFGLIAAFTGEWVVAFVDLVIVGFVVAGKLLR